MYIRGKLKYKATGCSKTGRSEADKGMLAAPARVASRLTGMEGMPGAGTGVSMPTPATMPECCV